VKTQERQKLRPIIYFGPGNIFDVAVTGLGHLAGSEGMADIIALGGKDADPADPDREKLKPLVRHTVER
jgi:hypothetical protein